MVLRDQIYNTIRERIINGVYAPGQPLNEKAIIEELHISRTPFREAINALKEEELVTVYPHRGIFVRELSLKDISDGFDIRCLLEPYVLRLACLRMPISKIDELIERSSHPDTTDYVSMLQEDDYFHSTLIRYVDNKQLTRIMENLYAYNRFQVTLFDDLKENYITDERLQGVIDSNHEHLAILQCMKERNADAAVEKMQYHLAQARKRIFK